VRLSVLVLNSVLFHAYVCLYEPTLLMYSYAYYLSMYAPYVVIYLLFMDDAWKKEKLSFVLKLA
jgi:hypothetical protein